MPRFSLQVLLLAIFFGILTDKGSKHKFGDVVIFPVQPQ